MEIYNIKNKLNEHGFYTVGENCINGEFYRFNVMLKTDEKKKVKSAICNWFGDKYGNYVVCFNGYDSISLQSYKTNKIEDFYFHDFELMHDFLIKYNGWEDYEKNKKLLERFLKLNKLTKKWVKNI